ncbi:MAG: NAD+ synthase [Verrucomicrobia bacterium]|jgi:NAD+ synthase (glutamine-hydrolysing)|nr:NAD+ synthase [Verrucomicrobiota bacterium]
MKVGLAQINTIVGDLPGNRKKILTAYEELAGEGADLVVFPELAVTGYPPRDLLFKSSFVPDNLKSLDVIARSTGKVPALVGFVQPNPAEKGRRFYNAAAWCERGKIRHVARKCLLPTYDVFDEDRYFEAASEPLCVSWKGWRIGITLCEDIWTGPIIDTSRYYATDPLASFEPSDVDIVVNLSASPWHYGKDSTRQAIVRSVALRVGRPVIYVNAVGGNDELVFDGHSMVISGAGELLAGLPPFRECHSVFDLNTEEPVVDPAFQRDSLADIHDALVLGIRDYAHKSGFTKGLVGLSGGIDSALTVALATEALGAENVMGVSLPSSISSGHSRDDARAVAENLGITYHTLPIEKVVNAAGESLEPLFAGLSPDVTEENIQARSRGLLLMALSNKFGALLLSTGNKSEMAVGYCTLYGDMAGGLSVLSDLPKTRVYALSHYVNRERELIPWNTINKPPSAELRPDQKDEDSLPPYPVLDAVLKRYIEEGQSSREIIEAGYDAGIVREVIRKVDLNEYKRKQAAPGLKITPLAFGTGRRIPIVQRYVGQV